MRKSFFQSLEAIAGANKNIFVITADLGVKFFQNFRDSCSDRFINVGIAEANMIGVASGLAMSHKNVYCYSIIPFLIMRTLEQIRVDLCYNNLNVKLLGAGGGLVYGMEGITHHAIEDIGVMRSLPNITIVAPGDMLEAQALAEESVNHKGPLYIRFARDADPAVHEKRGFDFKIGKGILVHEGKDICIMATGSMLYPAKVVLQTLKAQGITPTLVSLHTIKPLDREIIEDCAGTHKAIFTLEEHNIIGGLGSAVAEILCEKGYRGLFKRIGILDRYCSDVGGVDYLRAKAGLTPELITAGILEQKRYWGN